MDSENANFNVTQTQSRARYLRIYSKLMLKAGIHPNQLRQGEENVM